MDELYLDNIDEFVNDHNKIVTYKWLSLTLGVHVNTAKQMLYHYLDHKRKESSEPLHATYLVSGKLVENGLTCHKVSVVREDQLEDVKSKMSMTVSVHVYSVQKAVLKDSGPLYSVDYDAVKDNMKNCSKYSAIQCASAVPMSRAEVQQKHPTVVEPQSVKPTVNGHASLTSKPTTKSPKGIMGMFATKPATKKQEASKAIKPEPKEEAPAVDEAPKSKPAGKTNPMSNFFGNQAAKRPEKKEEKKEEEVQPASSEEPRPSASRPEVKQIDVPAPQEQTKDTKKETKDTKKEIRSSKIKTKRIQESDSEEEKMDKKRRRRIKRPVSDSSEEEEEEVIPDSPQPQKRREPSPCPEDDVKEESLSHANQQHSDGKRRKRRRVLKSRTFVDEDGCMVTEKGYESESYSETEEEAPSSQAASKHPVQAKLPSSKKDDDKKKKEKKSVANASKGTKQASIMGFFQKK